MTTAHFGSSGVSNCVRYDLLKDHSLSNNHLTKTFWFFG